MSITEHRHVSDAEVGSRRVEIFTGAGRRRSWTPQEKATIVAKRFENGVRAVRIRRRPQVVGFQDFESNRLRCSLINSTSVSMPKSVNAMTWSSPVP